MSGFGFFLIASNHPEEISSHPEKFFKKKKKKEKCILYRHQIQCLRLGKSLFPLFLVSAGARSEAGRGSGQRSSGAAPRARTASALAPGIRASCGAPSPVPTAGPLLPATGEGLRSTSHLLFHCNERQRDRVSRGRAGESGLSPLRARGGGRGPPRAEGAPGAGTFFPSLNLT